MVCGGMLAFNALIAIRRTGIAPSQRGRFTRIVGKADVARRSFEIDGGGHGGIDARLFERSIARRSAALAHALSCSSSDLASFKSTVSKPSVNQP